MVGSAQVLLLAALAAADGPPPGAVRPQTPRLAAGYALATESSQTFRNLAASLAEQHVLVFVVSGTCDMGRREACLPHRIRSTNGYRVLQVVVRDDIPPVRLAGVLAHELRHALEVAEGGVTDSSGFDALFKRIGRPCEEQRVGTCYETEAAIDIQARVVEEVNSAIGDGRR